MHAKTVLRFALVVQIFVRDDDDDDDDDIDDDVDFNPSLKGGWKRH